MKTISLQTVAKAAMLALTLPLAAWAQTSVPVPTTQETYGAHVGMHEFTFGANGVSNKDLNDSFGGLNFSIGSYISENLEAVIRQSASYSNPSPGSSAWNGSTRLAFDQHFGHGAVRPFLGVNFGGIYGDTVRDTFAAGIEGGVKFYVQPRTFLFVMAEYAWSFRHARSISDRFDDGQLNWGAGIGFNF